MVDHPAAAHPLDAAVHSALAMPAAALAVRAVEGLRVLALRHLSGGAAAVNGAVAAHGLSLLPSPGACQGTDPWLVWTGPAECLLLTLDSAVADDLLQALAPGREVLACALDQSAGYMVFELCGEDITSVLPCLLDANAIPQQPGQGSRTRLMDISALVMRLGSDRVWIAVDRTHGSYAAHWIEHCLAVVASPT